MAVYNEIQVGRYNRFLQKLLQMKGGAPAPQLSSEIMPILSFFGGAENRFLEGWQRFAINVSVPAVAAQTGAFRLRNPVGSNVIGVVEKLLVSNNQAATILVAYQIQNATAAVDLTPTAAPGFFDGRSKIGNNLLSSSANNVAGLGNTMCQVLLNNNTIWEFIWTDIQEFPLAPGDTLQILDSTVNTSFICSVQWRERFLEEAERQ